MLRGGLRALAAMEGCWRRQIYTGGRRSFRGFHSIAGGTMLQRKCLGGQRGGKKERAVDAVEGHGPVLGADGATMHSSGSVDNAVLFQRCHSSTLP